MGKVIHFQSPGTVILFVIHSNLPQAKSVGKDDNLCYLT